MKIEAFLNDLAIQTTNSKETRRAYRQDLKMYEAFLRMKGLRVTQAKPSTIKEFINHLADKHGGDFAPATVSRRLSVLSSYYEFLRNDSDESISNPVQRVKRPQVDNETVRAVADNALATLVDGITDVRDKAIVLLFVYSGLRLPYDHSELSRLFQIQDSSKVEGCPSR
jgi:site-specific recombinase XerD